MTAYSLNLPGLNIKLPNLWFVLQPLDLVMFSNSLYKNLNVLADGTLILVMK